MSSQKTLEDRQAAAFASIEECLTRLLTKIEALSEISMESGKSTLKDSGEFYKVVDESLDNLLEYLRELAVLSYSLNENFEQSKREKSAPRV